MKRLLWLNPVHFNATVFVVIVLSVSACGASDRSIGFRGDSATITLDQRGAVVRVGDSKRVADSSTLRLADGLSVTIVGIPEGRFIDVNGLQVREGTVRIESGIPRLLTNGVITVRRCERDGAIVPLEVTVTVARIEGQVRRIGTLFKTSWSRPIYPAGELERLSGLRCSFLIEGLNPGSTTEEELPITFVFGVEGIETVFAGSYITKRAFRLPNPDSHGYDDLATYALGEAGPPGFRYACCRSSSSTGLPGTSPFIFGLVDDFVGAQTNGRNASEPRGGR